MATRSRIAIRNSNDEGYTSVYVHWDGSPDTRMPLLKKHWMDENKIRKLVEGGDVSSIGVDFSDTRSYAKERGEELRILRSPSLDELRYDSGYIGEEYLYIFENNKWRYEGI